MSTLVLPIEVYNDVLQKVQTYKFKKEVNKDYCGALSNFTEKQAYQLVQRWCKLNELSYVAEYEHKGFTMDDLYKFIVNVYTGRNLNPFQMLKHLQAIRYNIDLVSMHDKGVFLTELDLNSVTTLDKAIAELMQNIIDEIPEYQAAKWSDQNNL